MVEANIFVPRDAGTLGAFFIAMKKAEKTLFVQDLSEQLKSATAVVLIDYTHLTVKGQQELKKRLREVEARMVVVKNTLFRIAGKEAKVSEDSLSDSVLSGPTAVIISEKDPIAPLQVLYKFSQEFEIPQFKVGIIDGSFQNKEALTAIAKLPSKEILFAQTVGVIAQPMYGLVGVLQANLQKLVFIISEYKSMRAGE